jgi:biopolymer transport protein ExbD
MAGGGGGEVEDDSGSRGGPFGEAATPPVTLNLTALMDILSNLLFFLLSAFGATIVMAINATVPVQSANKSDMADTKQQVTVNIALKPDGFDVAAVGTAQTPEELAKLGRHIGLKNKDLDYQTLTDTLVGIKTKYPKSDTIILTPEPGMKYEAMVNTMDAAREIEQKVGGEMRMIPLFPSVVVSTVIK